MIDYFGGWLWFVIDVVAVVALAGAMLYGTRMWQTRSRDPRVERASDDATRRLYQHSPNAER